jgi:membrane fusion protein, copper/silver efflux system
MMKMKICLYVLLSTMFTACHIRHPEAKLAIAKAEDEYTCSMHPQILEHQPGNCPICGMQLIKKNQTSVSINDIPLETLIKPVNGFVITTVPVTTPQSKDIKIPVKAYGVIEYDSRGAVSISARVSGRIEKLYVRYRYQEVDAGQKIMDIYSPEIITAEQNLLFLLKNDAGNISFIQSAKERLQLLGISEDQLQQVVKTGKPLYSIGVYSKYGGHVHDAGMTHDAVQSVDMNAANPVTQELSLKEGMYVQKGQTLLMLMNHHDTWAALQIFAQDQSLVKVGQTVNIIPETDTTAKIQARINFIEPFFRPGSKTITARVYFHNNSMLPVGSHVSASIYTGGHHALWIPQTAVLSLGMNQVAFLKTGVGFITHKLMLGLKSGNEVEVISGLGANDTLAINGQYFIDSESFIKSSSK